MVTTSFSVHTDEAWWWSRRTIEKLLPSTFLSKCTSLVRLLQAGIKSQLLRATILLQTIDDDTYLNTDGYFFQSWYLSLNMSYFILDVQWNQPPITPLWWGFKKICSQGFCQSLLTWGDGKWHCRACQREGYWEGGVGPLQSWSTKK